MLGESRLIGARCFFSASLHSLIRGLRNIRGSQFSRALATKSSREGPVY
jgi:hypothetical protein